MAELSVKIEFQNRQFKILRNIARLSFPLWGLAFPCAAVICGIFFICILFYSDRDHLLEPASYAGVCLLFSLAGLLLQAISVPGNIILTKSGIGLPYLHGQPELSKTTIPWEEITHIDVYDSSRKGDKVIAFFIESKPTLKLPLSEFKEEDLEQFFTAIELWAGAERFKDSLIEYKKNLTYTSSFTAMWEEELSRRFLPTAFVPLPPGRTMRKGALEVKRQIATGGLAAIYLCRQGKEELVLKEAVLPADLEVDKKSKAKEMFEREAKLLAKIDHPGIVKVRDYFIEDSRHYLVLDYLNGQDLRQLVLQNGPRREDRVRQMAEQICAVMTYLHSQEPAILHRDLTPDNMVMTNDGSVVIIDFGAANEFLGAATGTLVGKQAFISPEQFRGKACIASDIYSFGCTLYFLLTGKDPEALSVSHPKEINGLISDEMNGLVAKCTEMDLENRFQTFVQIKNELESKA